MSDPYQTSLRNFGGASKRPAYMAIIEAQAEATRALLMATVETFRLRSQEFIIGDVVRVCRADRLPLEESIGVGTIEKITRSVDGVLLFWVSGFSVASTAAVLRSVEGEP